MHAVHASGLGKTFGAFGRAGRTALRDVHLEVPSGSAFGLIGLNGAGKTTFIKILLGVVRPTTGRIEVLGGSPESPGVRARIGYLPERLHLPGTWSARGFLRSVARLKGLADGDAEARTQLGRVGLAAEAEHRLGSFSKGMRQRVGLAAALLGAPDLLVLDEPTDGIDPLGRVEIRRILQDELARGATVFLNSHLLAETERICTRVGILADGRLVREGPLAGLLAADGCWQARFAPGHDAAALIGAGFRPAGDHQFVVEAEGPDALDAALLRARATGARLIELVPHTDLERLLTETLAPGAEVSPEEAA